MSPDSMEIQNGGELDRMLAQAEDLCSEGRFEEAIRRLEDAAGKFPKSPLPLFNASVVHLNQLRKDYEHLEVWENLSEDERIFEAAVEKARQALEVDPEHVPSLNQLGALFALRGWWGDAAERWERSLAIQPEQPQQREDLRNAQAHLGD